uniref:Bile acid:sodium symporter n=1 Tax=Dunaliella tertiolecta TaxID=3047 RepID=A0A7S3QN71_DUNTE|mmetsp:Transcript_24188/g.66205  ORF Transcript_24188/g.66205 Transcript_24188/m.66205 type:complete len:407 (-) Transcript_24188:2320-3540(-)|eukprot:CAMPEP_0202375144 /NCGR_PEP_ID=MMETSP1127-20130417/5853_1 /ASSEMBLY_ACC=CAM_ASM_000462 /TAXON_ID=3047 /ORGANISM="Dunaliella tertiolecta, Strain CCMP1320" /LENGTH=406 /DNA_ID=CAMNT_0048972523 /DNA_START=855 /DNA_END=2078 /DNA_ORIENTATION=-
MQRLAVHRGPHLTACAAQPCWHDARSYAYIRGCRKGGRANPRHSGQQQSHLLSPRGRCLPGKASNGEGSSSSSSGGSGDAAAAAAAHIPPWEAALAEASQKITNLFPVWVVVGAIAALVQPSLFNWIPTPWITWLLAATMLGMGLTMKLADFSRVFTASPWLLLFGLGLQYTVMPCLGFAISRYAGLDAAAAIGITLLSSCPGGTASNIVAFIAKGEMGLSIMMTTASTFTAIFATPLLTQFLAGALVPVNAKALFMSTLQVVLAPVLLGVVLNGRYPGTISRIAKVTPAAASLLVALIVATTLAHSAEAARQSGAKLLAAVVGLHSCGFAIGYAASRMLGLSEKISRTNSIEVGMQNSTLGAVLASLHFSDPLVAVPCAISACCHSVIGSLLAAWWRDRTPVEAT